MKLKLDDVIADHYGPQTAQTYDQVALEKFWAYPEALNAVATDLVWSRQGLCDRQSLRILDIGAGTGNLSQAVIREVRSRCEIENRSLDIHLTMFDSSTFMLDRAATKMQNFELKSCDMTVGRLQDANWGTGYDVIISSFAIHHLEVSEKEDCIFNIFRSLNDGGAACLLDKMWIENILGPVPEDNFLRVAASKFYGLVKKRHPDVKLEDVAELIRQGFLNDGDRPSPLDYHLQWFHSAGFKDVQNPFTSFAAAVVSGEKR